jgi:hypothetical protein
MPAGSTRAIKQSDYMFVWGAITVQDGFAADDAIQIDQVGDDFVDEAGIGGEVTIVQQTDDRADILVRLQEGAPANQLLSAYRLLAKSGAAPKAVPFLAKGTGTSIYSGAKTWCVGPPKTIKMGAAVNVKEWRFRCAKLVRNDGTVAEV